MFGFGTAVRSRTSLPGEICVIASTALLEREQRVVIKIVGIYSRVAVSM